MQLHPETHRSTSPLPPDQVQPTSSSTHVHAAGLHSRHHHLHEHHHHSELRSKSPIPAPIQTSDHHRHAGEQTTSPIRLSFDERPSRQSTQSRPQKRHSSISSAISFSNNNNGNMSRKSTSSSGFNSGSGSGSSSNKRLSGTVQHRGRHANDWLFGGFSLRDQVAKLWRDRDDASDEEDETRDYGRGR